MNELFSKRQNVKNGISRRGRPIVLQNQPKHKAFKCAVVASIPVHAIRTDCLGNSFYTKNGIDQGPVVYLGDPYGTDING